MAQAAFKVTRPLIRLASAWAPRAMGRLAFDLFCRPIGHAKVDAANPAMARALALFEKGEGRSVTHGCGYVHATTFEPEGEARGTVLVLHGWTGQALFMAGFVPPLIEAGFRVIAMDMPGHGRSSGRRTNFPLAIEAIHAVTRGEPLAGIVAHSFGGAVAMGAIAGGVPHYPPLTAHRLVTIAAPKGMAHYGRFFTTMLGLTKRAHEAFEDAVAAVAGAPIASFHGPDYLRATRVPTLVIHAPDDKEIPFAEAEELAGAGDFVTLMPVPGLGHRRILGDPGVHRAAAAFLAGEAGDQIQPDNSRRTMASITSMPSSVALSAGM